MRAPSLIITSCLVTSSFLLTTSRHSPLATSSWQLTWSDEFSAPDGSSTDPSKWTYDLGGNGWGNQELETYTARPSNAQIRGGNLVITARRENFAGPDGIARQYTSARLKTQTRFAQAYGRFEARIKIPKGQGIWPAFWLLGDDIDRVGWPQCGEIDIMENVGGEPAINHSSLHGPTFTGSTSDATKTIALPAGQSLADDFHLYAIEWEPAQVRFYLDDNNYATFNRSAWPARGIWVFDHPFFILFNVSVGGNWPGPPDPTTQFPQEMQVDYVRVFSKTSR